MNPSRIARFLLVFAVVAAAAFFSSIGAVADTPATPDVHRAESESPADPSNVEPAALYSPQSAADLGSPSRSDQMQEIEAAFERGRAERLDLEARAAAATDEETILSLQRRIEELAQETELEILGIQARHARDAGNEELASRIERDIAEIRNPTVVRVRSERPAPVRR